MPDNARISVRIRIEPIDVLFFRDARPFGTASRASSGLPTPQTLAGALRTLLAELHELPVNSLRKRIRESGSIADAMSSLGAKGKSLSEFRSSGPWFETSSGRMHPMPHNLRRNASGGDVIRMDPLREPPSGWQPASDGMLPLWRHGNTPVEALDGYLNDKGLSAFLGGGVPDLADVVTGDDLYGFQDRTGIAINPDTGTAEDGMIYGVRFLSLKPGVGMTAECCGDAELLSPLLGGMHVMPFGGEGRRVRITCHEIDNELAHHQSASGDGRMLLLTSAAYLDGWCPGNLKPCAAAVSGYDAVSGWDLAKGGPKPNRFMVPAGSVYFLREGDDYPVDDLVSAEDALSGWGSFVGGYWNYV